MLHHPGITRGLRDYVGQNLRVYTECLADPKGFRYRNRRDARDQIVAKFRRLTGAHSADVNDGRPHGCEDWSRCFEISFRAADHDCKRCVFSADRATRHRRVDEPHIFVRKCSGDFALSVRIDG